MFTVGRKPFLDACMLASKSIPVRTTMPVLQCLKITATPMKITVFGTDLESETTAYVNDSIIVDRERSETCVMASQLIEGLRSFADEEVVATLGKNNLKIACGRSSFILPFTDPHTMPCGKFDTTSGLQPWTYDREDLIAVLGRSTLATAEGEQKYSYDKVMIDGRLFIGTDGKRISLQELSSTNETILKVMVMPKTVQILSNLLKGSHDDTADLFLTPNTITARTSAGIVTCRTAEGSLPPNVDRIIPKNMPWKTEFVVADLLRGVSQASIMTDKEATRVTFEFAGGELTIRAAHSTGKAEAVVTGDIPEGMTMKIHFDPSYIKDMLRTLVQKDKVVVHFAAPDKFMVMDIPHGKYAVTTLV